MLKKINTNFGTLYATDEPELIAKFLREKEAVLYICEDLEHAPFMDGVRYITDSYGLDDGKYLHGLCKTKTSSVNHSGNGKNNYQGNYRGRPSGII